jgi:Ca2+-binding EF-hand superfamily protein
MRPFLLLTAFLAAPAMAQERPAAPAQDAAPPVPARPAQPAPIVIAEPVAMMIAAFDADGDARVTRAEFDAGLRHSFDSVDTGHNGVIGYIAFSDWAERWMGDRNTLPSPFETDRDGDNKVSFAELAARFDLLFVRFDANKDGVIERKELVTIRPQMLGPGGAGRDGRRRDRRRGD